jgi:pimeloyl-ACP methyl ester carboxylesterase
MYLQGIGDRSAVTTAELRAYVRLLKRGDGGAAFLRIMSGFERTREKRDLYVGALRDATYPVQIVWGEHDPALRVDTHGEQARRAAGLEEIHRLPAKHFLQEDQAGPVAERIASLTRI